MPAVHRLFAVTLCLVTFAAGLRAADEFPYEAFVAVENAEVVSGPGHRYYATARLDHGTAVEVHREEASGWLAIRPPEGSFSWVPSEFVERSADDDAVGSVTEPTPAWVGTTAEKVKAHRQQVMLKAGELVSILDEKQIEADEDEPQTWLKIAPPAGEFRWIHLRDVSRTEPEPPEAAVIVEEREVGAELRDEDEDEGEGENEKIVEPRRFAPGASAIALHDIEPPARPSVRSSNQHDERVELAQYRNTPAPATRPLSPDGFVPRKRKGSEQLQTVPVPSQLMTRTTTPAFTRPKLDPPPLVADARPNRAPTSTTPITTETPGSSAVDRVADELQKLDLELSLMVAQNRSTWNLAGLRERVSALVETGSDPEARGRARLLLERIGQFEEAFDVQDFGPLAANSSAGTGVTADADEPTGPSPADPRYDGQGWLKPVVSRRDDKPVAPYALVDADGKPRLFVTPAPGLNINHYLNKQVGVYGRRGYIEALKAGHVTAERVIDLDRQLR